MTAARQKATVVQLAMFAVVFCLLAIFGLNNLRSGHAAPSRFDNQSDAPNVIGGEKTDGQASSSVRAPKLQADLEELVAQFNRMYRGRTPLTVVLKGVRVKQKQVFLGLYEKTPEGGYVQKNTCETAEGGIFAPGLHDGEQRLTIEQGKIILHATYRSKDGEVNNCSPAEVVRIGDRIVFREIEDNGRGSWLSNEFYTTHDGYHETIRRFKDQPEYTDVFVEERGK